MSMRYSLLALPLFTACALDADPTPAQEADLPPGPDPTLVHRTIVTLSPDGHDTVVQGFVHRARPSDGASIAQDPGCGTVGSFSMYTDPSLGATICFQGTGTASLWNYSFIAWDSVHQRWIAPPWKGYVRTYWPWVSPGSFTDSTCTGFFCSIERFSAFTPPTTAGSVARGADTLCLGPGC